MHTNVVAILIVALSIASCGESQNMAVVRSELAPSGKLRAGINFGNALLASRDAGGKPSGIALDLAQELARRLGVPLDIQLFESAGRMADGAADGRWEVAFLGADPARAQEIVFTNPYLEIDATYLLPADSSIQRLQDIDRDGVRIAVSEKSAYDLFLTRNLQRAQLVRVQGVDASADLFFREKLDALAGLRPLLLQLADSHPNLRVLEERFTTVDQAIGTPKSHAAALAYLQDYVNDIQGSGFLKSVIERNGVRGVTIPNPRQAGK
jgi:polar amino acid transport system substrate-binding protein